MDVGQIIATTDTAKRDRDPYRNENDDFSSYVNDTAPKEESPAKEKVADKADNNMPVDEPTNATNSADSSEKPAKTNASPEEDAPVQQQASAENTATSENAGTASQSGHNAEAAVTIPASPAPATATTAATVSPAANEKLADKTPAPAAGADKTAQAPVTDDAPAPATPEKAPAADAGQKPEVIANNTVAKNSDTAPTPAAAVAQANVKKPAEKNAMGTTTQSAGEKTTATSSNEVKATTTSSEALASLRAEANAKMSEKDILSSKIAEMLQDGRGKISLTASKQQQNFQNALASSTNLVTASMTNNAATANPAAVSGVPGDVEVALPQAVAPTTTGTQALSTDPTNPAMPAAPTGSVQGVEATATNNMSQASNAARAAAHLPVAEQVSTQISTAIKEGQDRIKISLHPSELGRVEVKLDIGHDGRVLAVVSVDKQETLDLLQRDARSLERALQDAGFDTGSNSLNFGLSQNGQEGHSGDLNLANKSMPIDEAGEDGDLPDLPLRASNGTLTNNSGLDIQV